MESKTQSHPSQHLAASPFLPSSFQCFLVQVRNHVVRDVVLVNQLEKTRTATKSAQAAVERFGGEHVLRLAVQEAETLSKKAAESHSHSCFFRCHSRIALKMANGVKTRLMHEKS
jgi:hypothetical protein